MSSFFFFESVCMCAWLQHTGSPPGYNPPAGQWASLRVPPTIFHLATRLHIVLRPKQPAKATQSVSLPRLKKVGTHCCIAPSTHNISLAAVQRDRTAG